MATKRTKPVIPAIEESAQTPTSRATKAIREQATTPKPRASKTATTQAIQEQATTPKPRKPRTPRVKPSATPTAPSAPSTAVTPSGQRIGPYPTKERVQLPKPAEPARPYKPDWVFYRDKHPVPTGHGVGPYATRERVQTSAPRIETPQRPSGISNPPVPSGPARTGYKPDWIPYEPSAKSPWLQRLASVATRAAVPLGAIAGAVELGRQLKGHIDENVDAGARQAVIDRLSSRVATRPTASAAPAAPAAPTAPAVSAVPVAPMGGAEDMVSRYYDAAFARMGLSPEQRSAAIQGDLYSPRTKQPGLYDISPDPVQRIYKQVDKKGQTSYFGVGLPEAPQRLTTRDYVAQLLASPYTTAADATALMQTLGQLEAQQASTMAADKRHAETIAAGDRRLAATLRSKDRAAIIGLIANDIQSMQNMLNTGQAEGPVPRRLTAEETAKLREDMQARLNLLNSLLYEDGENVTGYAEGGEVEPAIAVNPTMQGKAAGMESGDYVFPAEAVRYYGLKMLKDMVQKALVAG